MWRTDIWTHWTHLHTHALTHTYPRISLPLRIQEVIQEVISLWLSLGKGEGGMNEESSIEMYAVPRAEQIANGKSQYNTGSSARSETT